MKAKVITVGETQLKQMIKTECEKQKDAMYKDVLIDVLPQFMAVNMWALKQLGFGEVRLRRFLDTVKASYSLMDTGILGRGFDPVDLIESFKKDYNIDLDEELKQNQ